MAPSLKRLKSHHRFAYSSRSPIYQQSTLVTNHLLCAFPNFPLFKVYLVMQAFQAFGKVSKENINLNERQYWDWKLFHHLVNVSLYNKMFSEGGKKSHMAGINNLKYPCAPPDSCCWAQLLENLISGGILCWKHLTLRFCACNSGISIQISPHVAVRYLLNECQLSCPKSSFAFAVEYLPQA